jgi:hypothetical protein
LLEEPAPSEPWFDEAGSPDFDNYRIRALLYAGKPNWRVLGSIVVQ